MTPTQIVLLVGGILAAQLLFWIPFAIWLRRKSARLTAALRDELSAAGEHATRGPEPAVYRGATAGYPLVNGNGVAVLTDRRLVFRKLIGAGLEVPLERVVGVREDKWFLVGYRNGQMHLILRTSDGNEVGFMFADHPGWMTTVRAITTRAV
jgi:hypothetical protein